MAKKESTLDWEFMAEEDQDKPWPPDPQSTTDDSGLIAHPRLRRVVLFCVAMAFLVVVGIGGVYARQTALQGIQEVEQGVQAAVEAEQWVQHNTPELAVDLMIDNDASSFMAWVVEHERLLLAMNANDAASAPDVYIEDVRYANGVASADLTLTQPVDKEGAPVTYRQTRFYRETEKGWLRTKPDPALWGAPLSLETDHLIWYYRQRDHDVIAEIAAQTDALYVRLQRDYGLAKTSEDGKPIINVQVDYLPGLISLYSLPAESIVVPSPSVYLVPSEWTDADILVQTVSVSLLKSTWAQATAQHGIDQLWAFKAGMSLWQMGEMGLYLSEWRDDVVQWAYEDDASAGDGSPAILPVRYQELCAAHSPLMMKPTAIGIPLYCDSRDSAPFYNGIFPISLQRTDLNKLRVTFNALQEPSVGRLGNPITIYTAIDYAVMAYGRERLPALVAALGEHDTWETLVPAVYGVSLDEFEQGWRQHVANMVQ